MVVRFFVRVRVIRHQAEVIQVGCDSFQHADYPRAVESNKLRLEIFIGPKIHNHVFATFRAGPELVGSDDALSRNQRSSCGAQLPFRRRGMAPICADFSAASLGKFLHPTRPSICELLDALGKASERFIDVLQYLGFCALRT